MENLIERTDFYSVPVQDMERAKAFYSDILGMHSPDWDAGFPEESTRPMRFGRPCCAATIW